MPKPIRSFRWHDPLYGIRYTLLIGGTTSSLNLRLRRIYGSKTQIPDDGFVSAKCIWIETDLGHAIVLWLKRPRVTLAVHECYHAVQYVMRSRGIEPCEKAEEAFAYYMEWITAMVMERL